MHRISHITNLVLLNLQQYRTTEVHVSQDNDSK